MLIYIKLQTCQNKAHERFPAKVLDRQWLKCAKMIKILQKHHAWKSHRHSAPNYLERSVPEVWDMEPREEVWGAQRYETWPKCGMQREEPSEGQKDMCEPQVPTLRAWRSEPHDFLCCFFSYQIKYPSISILLWRASTCVLSANHLSIQWDCEVGCCQHIHLPTMAICRGDAKPQCLEMNLLFVGISRTNISLATATETWIQKWEENLGSGKPFIYFLNCNYKNMHKHAFLVNSLCLPKPGPRASNVSVRWFWCWPVRRAAGNGRERKGIFPGWYE